MSAWAAFDRRVLACGAFLLAALATVAVPVAAHKAHQAPAMDTVTTTAGDSARGATPDGVAPAAPAPARFVMPPMGATLREHPHNRLVHFPVALTVGAALLFVLGRRRPEVRAAARWLVWLAALGGVAAYFTGRAQEGAFKGEPKEWLVRLHAAWGLAAAISLALWALLTLWPPARRRAWLWGLLAAALVLITGYLGGMVAHGE